MSVRVSTDNFVRAETARMFDGTLQRSELNEWWHLRGPVPLDAQSVIRMNRDTLYSSAIVDISKGATVTLPDVGDRYISVMVINEDHYINRILTEPGNHHLGVDEFETPYVAVTARTFVDPGDANDVAAVNAAQDEMRIDAASAAAYSHPDYDVATLDETRDALLTLSQGLPDTHRMFGAASDVDPIRHLIGTAFGWGGLPETEAFYVFESEPRPAGHQRITFRDVPVDSFWSFTVYDRNGYFGANPYDSYSLNSVTSHPDPDGSVTIDLAPTDDGYRNFLYVMDGWNYAIRFYRSRPAILDGSWEPPAPTSID